MKLLNERFIEWMRTREGGIYAALPLKHYTDGEPYFSCGGTECSIRDYMRLEEAVKGKFKVHYVSGGGREYDGGVWEMRETAKKIIFTLIAEPFFKIGWNRLEIWKDVTKNKRHCFRDWNDGTYTIYPDQCGTPHVFEPLPVPLISPAWPI